MQRNQTLHYAHHSQVSSRPIPHSIAEAVVGAAIGNTSSGDFSWDQQRILKSLGDSVSGRKMPKAPVRALKAFKVDAVVRLGIILTTEAAQPHVFRVGLVLCHAAPGEEIAHVRSDDFRGSSC